jgi:hypothetical protein
MEWISVKDRLPQNRDVVLVYTVGLSGLNGVQLARHLEDMPASIFWHGILMGAGCGVTHWMPLPDPPSPA